MIIIVGTVCLDRIRRVHKLPKPGGYAEIISERWALGGEAINTAIALQTWRIPTIVHTSAIGRGPEADWIREAISDARLKVMGHVGGDHPAPFCDIYVDDQGDRTLFGFGFVGRDHQVRLTDLDLPKDVWLTADPNLGETARSAVRQAHEAGMKVYLQDFVEPDDAQLPAAILQTSTDWVGARNDGRVNMQWAQSTADRTHRLTILTDGGRGLYVAKPGTMPRHVAAMSGQRSVDSTGAGDTFRAGMLYGLCQDWEIQKCLDFARAAGALKVELPGEVPSLEAIQEALRLNRS